MAYRVESASSLDPGGANQVLDIVHRGLSGQEQHGSDMVVSAPNQVEDSLLKPGTSVGDQNSFLQSATDFDIHGGNFANIAGDNYTASRDIHVTIHNHAHSLVLNENREDLHEHDETNEIQLPPLPIQRSCDIYRRHLASKGRGIPLWIPEPNKNLPIQYQRKGIAIGDVGIITASGSFAFLFNICLAHDHPINPSTLPMNFKPIHVAAVNIHYQSEFKNNSHLASASTVRSQNDGDSSGLVFESSASDGAILTMPVGSKSEDLGSVGRFRKYVAANMVNWYKYAYHDREYDVRNGDLRLVIGYDTTSFWGMATFSNSTAHQESFRLKFGLIEGRRYGWEYSGMAEVRAGPDAHEIVQLRDNDPSQEDINYENQCLFVRTINATLPDKVWDDLGFDYDELDVYADSDLPTGSSTPALEGSYRNYSSSAGPSISPPSNQVGTTSTSSRANDNILTVHATKSVYSSSTFLADHPSKAINAMLLKNCSEEVKMAITQDQDWMSVLTDEDTILPSSEDIIKRIQVAFDICEEDGVVYLTKILDRSLSVSTALAATIPQETEIYSENLSRVDQLLTIFDHTPTANTTSLPHDSSTYSKVTNHITLEAVPGFDTGVTILKSTYREIERLKLYKDKCKGISDRCFGLMNAVVDSSPELESTVLEMADEIAGIVFRFDRTVREWASWNRLKSFLRQREIKDGIDRLHKDIDRALSNFHIQINLELTQSVVEAKSIQDREHSEIRNILQTIVKSSDDMKALLSMQSSPGSRPVEDMMERLQTELMDPMLQSNKTEDYKAGLWLLHEKTSKLPPLTDLTGQIQWASLIPPAQGQFSEVYKGQWLDRETVALRLPRALINNPQIQHNFQNKVSIWRTLEHPNVIPIYGVVYVEETMYTVSPWMDNGTATIYVKKFPEVDRLKILTDVASGLEYLHNKGVIHGDLRGENVLISANGVAHVAEFGQSKFLEDFEQNAMAPHSGPLRWTAPEMLQETGSLSTHSDIWSYGMLCLEILSEELPYNNIQRDAAVLREIDSGHLPKRPVRATAHGLSDGMWTLLRKCWQQRPESRPSISEVRAQLLKLQGAQVSRENKPHFSMLKDRQKGRELQSSSSTTSTNSSTSNLDVFSEKATSSILDSRLSTGRTNLTSLPSSAVPTRPLSSDDGLLRLSHYSSDSIAEPLREALSDSRIVVDVVDGAVRRGTLEGLVQHLITTYNHNSPQDIEYRYLLLVACPDFTSPENLFIILSRRFHEVESDVDIRAEDKITWQYNIFTVIMYWLSEQDLKVEHHLLSRIKSFCEDAARIKASATMVNRARDLLQLVETRERNETVIRRADSVLPLGRMTLRSQITPSELAIALTLLEGDKYKVLTPADYLAHLRRHPGHNNIEGVYTTNNMIILWVKDSILHHDSTMDRASVLKFFVNTAAECRKLRNFSSLVAIATALHSSPIERLRLTRLELSMQVQNKLGALKDIFDVSANHRSYREALEEGIDTSGKGPCIPWLAIHLKELHAVLQRYPVVVQVDGRPLINFERYTKFMDRIKEAVHYTPPDMERYRQQGMLEYIENELLRTKLANITEEDLVTRSKKLEAQEMMERRSRKSQLRHLGFLKM